jgi:hypothetical protein
MSIQAHRAAVILTSLAVPAFCNEHKEDSVEPVNRAILLGPCPTKPHSNFKREETAHVSEEVSAVKMTPSDSLPHQNSSNPKYYVKHKSISHLQVHDLEPYFHLPIRKAAKELGSYEGALIRHCRRLGIQQWPYRTLSKINRKIKLFNNVKAKMKESFSDRVDDCPQIRINEKLHELAQMYTEVKTNALPSQEESDSINTAQRPSTDSIGIVEGQKLPASRPLNNIVTATTKSITTIMNKFSIACLLNTSYVDVFNM